MLCVVCCVVFVCCVLCVVCCFWCFILYLLIFNFSLFFSFSLSLLQGRRKALINNCLILCAFRGKYEFVKLILSDYSRDIDNNHKFLDTWSLCSVLMMNFSSDRLYNELLCKLFFF